MRQARDSDELIQLLSTHLETVASGDEQATLGPIEFNALGLDSPRTIEVTPTSGRPTIHTTDDSQQHSETFYHEISLRDIEEYGARTMAQSVVTDRLLPTLRA